MGEVRQVSPWGDTRTLSGGYTTLTEDELFEMLANRRRRHILHALMCEERPLEVGTLSTEIAASEDSVPVEQVTSKDRKRVYTALQQSHLPKMDKAGVIEFDKDRGTVTAAPALEDVEIYIDVVRGREIPWSEYYLGLTVLSAVVLVGSGVGVPPLTLLPELAWNVFVVVAFAFSAIAHRHYSRKNRLSIEGKPDEFERPAVRGE